MVTATSSLPQAQVEIEVRYDHSSQIELATTSMPLAEQLERATLALKDQESLDHLNHLIQIGRDWLKAADAVLDPVRDATHKAWKASIKAQDDFKGSVEAVVKKAQDEATKFVVAAREAAARQQAILDAADRKKQAELDAEQRRANEVEAKRVADELKNAGASREVIREAKAEVLATPAPAVAPSTVTPAIVTSGGQSVKTYYRAEITDMGELLKHFIQEPRWVLLLQSMDSIRKAIETELSAEATKLKERYCIPGTKLVKHNGSAYGGRR